MFVQVMFVAPARTREHALGLAAKAKALNVRPGVVARWARFLVASGQSRLFPELHHAEQPLQLNTAMLEWCDGQPRGAAIVPEQVTRCALHANNMEQARIILHVLNRGREGYANTRHGHADAPGAVDDSGALQAWDLEDDQGAAQHGEEHGMVRCGEGWRGGAQVRDVATRFPAADMHTTPTQWCITPPHVQAQQALMMTTGMCLMATPIGVISCKCSTEQHLSA